MLRLKHIGLAATLCLFGADPLLADDNSLYREAAPKDASFVRFIGFKAGEPAEFAKKSFEIAAQDEDAYLPVSAALLDGVEAGQFVSVVKTSDAGAVIIDEGARDSRSKVFLFLVNATQTTLDLRLADGSAVVVDGIASGLSGQRGVNPLAVELGVFESGLNTPIAVFDVKLQRGQNVSFIADETGVRLVQNRFGAVSK